MEIPIASSHLNLSHPPLPYRSIDRIKLHSAIASPLLPLNPRLSARFSLRSLSNGCSRRVWWRSGQFVRRPLREAPSLTRASRMEPEVSGGGGGRIVVLSAITVVLAVANRVLYKLALVPMKNYPFFMAQVTTFGYVAIYFSNLYLRNCTGIATKEMLALPKSPFVAIGFLEALGLSAGMSAGAMLPGPAIPILSQTFLVWQLVFSALILGRQYSFSQILGCLLVASGVVVAVSSGVLDGQFLSLEGFVWPVLMIGSSAFQAGASVVKEFVFLNAAEKLQGKPLDIFVVNSFGSGFQALFVFLLLPFLSSISGIPFAEFPTYLKSGAGCFIDFGSDTAGCDGAPLLPILFMMVNMAFNISLLNLVKNSSAVVSSLAATLAVPISIYILSLPLPYIPQGANLDRFFIIGSGILVLGLMLYNLPQSVKQKSKSD